MAVAHASTAMPPLTVEGELIAIDRVCPRCGATAGELCVDLLAGRGRRRSQITHIARGWLDRACPTCKAPAGSVCCTPGGRDAAAPHQARRYTP